MTTTTTTTTTTDDDDSSSKKQQQLTFILDCSCSCDQECFILNNKKRRLILKVDDYYYDDNKNNNNIVEHIQSVLLHQILLQQQQKKKKKNVSCCCTLTDISVYNDQISTFQSLSLIKNQMMMVMNHHVLLLQGSTKLRRRFLCQIETVPATKSSTSTAAAAVLSIEGRHFVDNNNNIMVLGRKLIIEENPNKSAGTGLNVWDGSVFLARYLEKHAASLFRGKNMLELGSGCGLAGIAAGFVGAYSVVLTDLEYTMKTLKSNVDRNEKLWRNAGCSFMECHVCDWWHPPPILNYSQKQLDYILLADCVWVEKLVHPLLKTLEKYTDANDAKVLISYQKRGQLVHELFYYGLEKLFNIQEMERLKISNATFFLWECTRKR